MSPAWAGPAWAHPLGPGLGPPTWAQHGPTHLGPSGGNLSRTCKCEAPEAPACRFTNASYALIDSNASYYAPINLGGVEWFRPSTICRCFLRQHVSRLGFVFFPASFRVAPCHVMPCHGFPCHARPYFRVSCHIFSCHAVS